MVAADPASGAAAIVLVVEDDKSIGSAMRDALVANGYTVEWCLDGTSAIERMELSPPDIVLLDAGLPDVDGFSLCRSIREENRELPIVIVTARDSEIDIVVGLDAGASDYVTKPFSMNVLLARVRAHLRGSDSRDPDESIHVGALRVDPVGYQVFANDKAVPLRRREFELLLLLSREAGRVVTRERILAEVWDLHWDTSTKTVEVHILALRRKLGEAIDIATVRGVGYRLDEQ